MYYYTGILYLYVLDSHVNMAGTSPDYSFWIFACNFYTSWEFRS